MNNREKALERLTALETEAAELRKIISEPEKPTYGDVVKKLKPKYWFGLGGDLQQHSGKDGYAFAYASEAITKREIIRAKFENIALFVNGCEQEEVRKLKCMCALYINRNGCISVVQHDIVTFVCEMYFISEDAAREALRILGEDEFRRM